MEKTCVENKRCNSINTKSLLDFDKIKTRYCRGKNPLPSVDGLLEINENLCFVELKSWENFFKYNSNASNEDIENQLNSYNLKGKFDSSLLICKEEINDNELFDNIQIVFVLVTDIPIEEKPEFSILHNLNSLASSSSDWKYERCNSLSKLKLNDINIDKFNVEKIYISCKEFDKKLDLYSGIVD